MFSSYNDVSLISYDNEHLYRIFSALPINELMKSYKVASSALELYFINDCETSVEVEYLSGVVSIMRCAIVDRISDFMKVGFVDSCL